MRQLAPYCGSAANGGAAPAATAPPLHALLCGWRFQRSAAGIACTRKLAAAGSDAMKRDARLYSGENVAGLGDKSACGGWYCRSWRRMKVTTLGWRGQ